METSHTDDHGNSTSTAGVKKDSKETTKPSRDICIQRGTYGSDGFLKRSRMLRRTGCRPSEPAQALRVVLFTMARSVSAAFCKDFQDLFVVQPVLRGKVP